MTSTSRYYLETGVNVSIAQQVFGPVDFVARFGASNPRVSRSRGAPVGRVGSRRSLSHLRRRRRLSPREDLRLGFNVDHQHRISEITDREYEGWRYGTSVTYGF